MMIVICKISDAWSETAITYAMVASRLLLSVLENANIGVLIGFFDIWKVSAKSNFHWCIYNTYIFMW